MNRGHLAGYAAVLALGVAGGWRLHQVDPQPVAALAQDASQPAGTAAPTPGESAHDVTAGPALWLIGTVLRAAPESAQAWLQDGTSAAARLYAQGDALPGGFTLSFVGNDRAIASRNGRDYLIPGRQPLTLPEPQADVLRHHHGARNRADATPPQARPSGPDASQTLRLDDPGADVHGRTLDPAEELRRFGDDGDKPVEKE